jgi:hypothetical protein
MQYFFAILDMGRDWGLAVRSMSKTGWHVHTCQFIERGSTVYAYVLWERPAT